MQRKRKIIKTFCAATITILLLAILPIAAVEADWSTFDHPDYYYAAITNAPDGTYYRSAGLNPTGTKIVAQKQWNSTHREIVLMDADGSNETVISAGDSGTGDIYGYMSPFWSDDGTVIGFVEVHNTTANKVIAYDVAAGTSSYIYEPVTGDVSNPDFLGDSKTNIVFWAYGDVGGADLWTWDGTTLTNITDTDDYKEYEPISNADGTKILYWSGETTAEPVNTTHTLTYSGGNWVKDDSFSPIADSYWVYWTTPDATHIALTVMSTKDVHLYDSDGNFVADLSGSGYSAGTIGGVNQWNFFGSMPEGPSGEFVITSNAGRGSTAGRDIIIANPRAVFYVDSTGSDNNPGTQAAPFATIHKAAEESLDGTVIHVAAGTYQENVTVDKQVSILGAGSGTDGTVVTTPAAFDNKEGVFQITGSGLSTSEPILLQDLRIEPVGQAGISVGRFCEDTDTSVSYLTLDNVFVIGTNANPSTEQERGLYVDNTSTLDYLTITDSAFNNLTYGWYFQKEVSEDTSTVSNIDVSNTTFNHNNHKGVYAEKMTEAAFTDCTFDQNGFDASVLPSYFAPWSAGVDLNLKAGAYQNISFYNPTVTNNATGGAKEGVGMTLKARDDGSYATYPATLDNVLITGGTFTGNERGIRIGEPGKDNAGPTNVVVSYNAFANNVPQYGGGDGSAYGALINATAAGNTITAEKNFWGHGSGPDTSAMTVGDPNPHGVEAQGEAAVGEMTVIPWYGSATTTPTTEYVITTHNPIIAYSDTIQGAVDAALAGDSVDIAAGTYTEQVTIDKELTLTGAGDTTIIEAPTSIGICWSTSKDHHAIVCITNTDNVTIQDLNINGKGNGNSNNRFIGVGFRNAGGILDNLDITGIRDTPFSGAQHGVAIYDWNDDGASHAITIQNCAIDDFQKNAIALNADETSPLTVDVQHNTITGAGATDVTVQNGIQVWAAEADGTIANNTIDGIGYTGSSWVASSILIYQNYFGHLLIDNNTITGAQTGVYNYDGEATISNNSFEIEMMGDSAYGILVSGPTTPAPAPFDEANLTEAQTAQPRETISISILDNTFTQTAETNTESHGIKAIAGWSNYDIDLIITGNTFDNFDYSIAFHQEGSDTDTFTNVEVHQNCINNSGSYGLWNNADYMTVNADNNWWGSWYGPYHPTLNPAGNGGEISDDVDYKPWLDSCGGNAISGIYFFPLTNK